MEYKKGDCHLWNNDFFLNYNEEDEIDNQYDLNSIICKFNQTIQQFNNKESAYQILQLIQNYPSYDLYKSEQMIYLFNQHKIIPILIDFLSSSQLEEQNINTFYFVFSNLSTIEWYASQLSMFCFIPMFFKNFNCISNESQYFGIITMNNIISKTERNLNIENFMSNEIQMLLNMFKSYQNEITLTFWLLYKKYYSIIEGHTSTILTLLNSEIHNKSDPQFLENASKLVLLILTNNSSLTKTYFINFHKMIDIIYNFGGVQAEINILNIWRLIIDHSNTKIAQVIQITFLPAPSIIFNDLLKVPAKRESFLHLFLSISKKGPQFLNHLLQAGLINCIFQIKDELSFKCLEIISDLLFYIIPSNFTGYSQILSIIIKMLDYDDSEFVKKTLANLFDLLGKMSTTQSKEEIQNYINYCDGYNILAELSQNFQEAQIIMNNLL